MVQSDRLPGRSCSTPSTSLLDSCKSHHFRFGSDISVSLYSHCQRTKKTAIHPEHQVHCPTLKGWQSCPEKTFPRKPFRLKQRTSYTADLSGSITFFNFFFAAFAANLPVSKSGRNLQPQFRLVNIFFRLFFRPVSTPEFREQRLDFIEIIRDILVATRRIPFGGQTRG